MILGIDQGTSGTLVGLMNADGDIIARADRPHRQIYPQPGWVEQDPMELWYNACAMINQVMKQRGVSAREIAGIGLANQGESVMLWDRGSGRPLSNVLVWQDSRAQPLIDHLAAEPENVRQVAARTGLRLDSYFSAGKIRWLLDTNPDVGEYLADGLLCCGTLDTWLIWKLTQGAAFVTDYSTASRTPLFNIHTRQWDDWLLKLFGIPAEILPTVTASATDFGEVSFSALDCAGAPILASLVDQPAAMVGHGCLDAGQMKATYGTGCFINLNTGQQPSASQRALLTFLGWQRDGLTTFGLEGGVFTAAAAVNWLRSGANLLGESESMDDLCLSVPDNGGVVWIPAQIGLGAPYWDRSTRGAWLGIGLETTRAHLARAVLEGIALRVVQVVRAMQADTGLVSASLRVDGGLTNSAVLMQTQADLLGLPVEVLADQEATLRGVCSLAARQAGLWTSDGAIRRHVQIARTYQPTRSDEQRTARLTRFEQAVSLLREWHRE